MVMIDIRNDKERPYLIQADNLTSVQFNHKENTLRLFTKDGQQAYLDYASYNLNPSTVLDALQNGGVELVNFPARYGDAARDAVLEKEQTRFISAAAISYITHTKENENGERRAIIGIAGIGSEDTSSIKRDEFTALMAAVKKSGIELQAYEPEDAYSRLNNPEKLYINPQHVCRIEDQRDQLLVSFEYGGYLDVQIVKRDLNQYTQNLLAAAPAELSKEYIQQYRADVTAFKENEEIRHNTMRRTFVDNILAVNDRLTLIAPTSNLNCTLTKNIASIATYDHPSETAGDATLYTLHIEDKKAGTSQLSRGLTARFNSVNARTEALNDLVATLQSKIAVTKSPKL